MAAKLALHPFASSLFDNVPSLQDAVDGVLHVDIELAAHPDINTAHTRHSSIKQSSGNINGVIAVFLKIITEQMNFSLEPVFRCSVHKI